MIAMDRKLLLLAAPLLGLAMLAAPALAQLGGHNSNAPVDVGADRLEVQDRADRAVFSGNVVARQGNMTLNASRVTVAYRSAGGIDIKRIDASGGVRLTRPSESAVGQSAIYDLDRRIVTMIGGVTLNQGRNRVSGNRLTLDLDSGRAVMDGGGNSGNGGRVTGTFTVPRRN